LERHGAMQAVFDGTSRFSPRFEEKCNPGWFAV
jgi:hypothetical protein